MKTIKKTICLYGNFLLIGTLLIVLGILIGSLITYHNSPLNVCVENHRVELVIAIGAGIITGIASGAILEIIHIRREANIWCRSLPKVIHKLSRYIGLLDKKTINLVDFSKEYEAFEAHISQPKIYKTEVYIPKQIKNILNRYDKIISNNYGRAMCFQPIEPSFEDRINELYKEITGYYTNK